MARVRCYASGMLDDIRKKVEAGIGSLSKQGPDELGAAVLGKAREAADQLSGLAAGMIEWSAAARERLSGDVRDLVARCVDEMGLVTRKELDALAKRVARLEKAAAARGSGAATVGGATKKAATSKAASAKSASVRRSSTRSTRESPGR
jgi:BMFP domain-containing protein YqiC